MTDTKPLNAEEEPADTLAGLVEQFRRGVPLRFSTSERILADLYQQQAETIRGLTAVLEPILTLNDLHEVWNYSDWHNQNEVDRLEALAWQWFHDARAALAAADGGQP